MGRKISHPFALLTPWAQSLNREILLFEQEHEFHIFDLTCALFITWGIQIRNGDTCLQIPVSAISGSIKSNQN